MRQRSSAIVARGSAAALPAAGGDRASLCIAAGAGGCARKMTLAARDPMAAGREAAGLAPDFAPTPLWSDDVAYPESSAGAWPARVDVLVIGAGYTGLAAAR